MGRNAKNTRMCAGCRTRCDKSQLVRICRHGEDITIAAHGEHIEGRSVYICRSQKCLETAIKRKSFARSLKCEIPSLLQNTLLNYVKSLDME